MQRKVLFSLSVLLVFALASTVVFAEAKEPPVPANLQVGIYGAQALPYGLQTGNAIKGTTFRSRLAGQGVSPLETITKAGTVAEGGKVLAGNMASNAAMMAAFTILMDGYDQWNEGQSYDAKRGVKSVISRQFAGALLGFTVGELAGTALFAHVLPVQLKPFALLGGTALAFGMADMGARTGRDWKESGKLSLTAAFKRTDKAEWGASAVGASAGMIVGNAMCPILGGAIGAFAGNIAGRKVLDYSRRGVARVPGVKKSLRHGGAQAPVEDLEISYAGVPNAD